MKALKVVKNFLIVGNDPVVHVAIGAYCVYQFKWLGLMPTFFSHFILDMIPHGHVESMFWEGLKGAVLALGICLWAWLAHHDPAVVVMLATGIFVALAFDFILIGASKLDKKKIWEWFGNPLKGAVKKIIAFVIKLNFFLHWFGRSPTFQYLWKSPPEIYNCGVEGNGITPSWWNLWHLWLAAAAVVMYAAST